MAELTAVGMPWARNIAGPLAQGQAQEPPVASAYKVTGAPPDRYSAMPVAQRMLLLAPAGQLTGTAMLLTREAGAASTSCERIRVLSFAGGWGGATHRQEGARAPGAHGVRGWQGGRERRSAWEPLSTLTPSPRPCEGTVATSGPH